MHASWIYILFNDDFQLSLIRDASTRKGYYMSAYKRDKNCQKKHTVPERIRAAGFTELRWKPQRDDLTTNRQGLRVIMQI